MNKKLLAVAVAGVFAAPAAFAQSSVVISGTIKGGYESLKIGNYSAARLGNNSQTGVVDDSSSLVFSVTEDLGGGMQAVVRLDMRIKPDDGGGPSGAGVLQGGLNPGNIVSGNSHFGLRSNEWGRIVMGRQDLHYFNTESNITDKGSLRASPVSLLSYANSGISSIASATRTPNVVHYLSPNWSGFTFILAYSSAPGTVDADIASGIRKGSAWNFNPNYAAANWQVGYSYWSAKNDGTTGISNATQTQLAGQVGATAQIATVGAASTDQRSDRLYGSYVFPFGLKIGGAWDKSRIKSTAAGVGDISKRTAWSIPVSYAWGNHTIHVNYSIAEKDKAAPFNPAAGQLDTKATMWGLAYSYDLSKRTSLALTYAAINNHSAARYNLFASTSLGLGNTAGNMLGGEDPKMFGLTMRHAF